MKITITIAQIVFSLVLTALVLLQAKGTGLGRSFSSASYHSRRGMEFVLFRLTIFSSIVFVLLAVAGLFIT